ncbi:MAG: phosphatase PAP2 family protein [Burkholderiaceae bacterium]
MPDAMHAVELARIIGEHALIAFGTALSTLLLFAGGARSAVHRQSMRGDGAPDVANARALRTIALFALLAVLAAALLFATLPRWIVLNGWLALADQALTDAIHRSVPMPVVQAFGAITVLASPVVLWVAAIVGALALLRHRRYDLALFWIAAIAGNGILTRVLKAIFVRARPLYDHTLFTAAGWSFPSGHSSGAVAAYGALAYVLIRLTPPRRHLAIILAAIATAFAVGCSRIFMQVHFASDVLAGFATGLAWLSVCVMAAEIVRRRRPTNTIPS